jgi:hypothetical protein
MTRNDLIRKEILFQLYTFRPKALSVERITLDARKNDYDYSKAEIAREAEFLADEELITRTSTPGTTAIFYRLHAKGIRHYEQNYAE